MGTAPDTTTPTESDTETETETTPDTDPDAEPSPDETETASTLKDVLKGGTFTLSDLSVDQAHYEQVGVDVGVHADKDQLEANWGHRFVHPDKYPDFRAPDKLKTRLRAQIDPYLNAGSDRIPRVRLVGPTGSAKTLAARYFACELAKEDEDWPFDMGYPMFEITMSHVTSQAKLVGHPSMSEDGNSTEYILGPIPKALLASQVCPVVLFLDEVNRSPVKDELYAAIDGRSQIRIDGLGGGLTIRGNPENLIVVSAMNAGPGYKIETIDFAEQRRLGPVELIAYLAEYDQTPIEDYSDWDGVEEETELVADLSPASKDTAEHIVSAGQNIRAMAREGDVQIKPIPTDDLVDWAKLANMFHERGVRDPLYEAGKQVAKGVYDQTRSFNPHETSPLETVITSKITDVKAVKYKPSEETDDEGDDGDGDTADTDPDEVSDLTDLPNVGPKIAENLENAGYDTPDDVRDAVRNGQGINHVHEVGKQTAEAVAEWANETTQDDPADTSPTPASTGVEKCKAGCGFEIDTQTADKYRNDPAAHPDDDNDYNMLKFGRCPNCGQPIATDD